MTDAINATTPVTEPKFTENCPVALQDLGKRIAVQYEKALKYEDKADQNYTTVAQLLATAHGACDEGGFNAFRDKFFPSLGQSRVYELLAIGTGKKTVEETRADTRARVTRHRANKAAALASVTVTDKTGAQNAPMDAGSAEAACALAAPTKRRMGDLQALVAFSTAVRELIRVTGNEKAERFAKTSVTADELERRGKFLIAIANLKVSGADVPVLPGNGTARNAKEVRP